jgi:uncharacterized phage-associated protein
MSYLSVPPFDAKAVANYFLELANRDGKTLDAMKIQKLVYLAHGWSLALLGRPLIADKIEAWQYGPVIRSLYGAFADCGSGPIQHPALDARRAEGGRLVLTPARLEGIESPFNAKVKGLLDEVWRAYGSYTGIELSNYTHQDGTPWAQTWRPGVDGLVISDESIKDHFHQLATANEPAR